MTNPKHKKINDEVCMELYNNGWSDSKIARYFNCSHKCVCRWRYRRNLICKSGYRKVYNFKEVLQKNYQSSRVSDLRRKLKNPINFIENRRKREREFYKKNKDKITKQKRERYYKLKELTR